MFNFFSWTTNFLISQSEFPNIKVIDTSWFTVASTNRISIDMTTHTALNLEKRYNTYDYKLNFGLNQTNIKKWSITDDRPCNEDPKYNFAKCVDTYYYKK